MAIGAPNGIASAALQAYRATQGLGVQGFGVQAVALPGTPDAGGGFGGMLQSALQGVVDQSHTAEDQSRQAIAGHGNLLDVVAAVSKAELSLQTTVAVRDRVVQAYQDIMRMPI